MLRRSDLEPFMDLPEDDGQSMTLGEVKDDVNEDTKSISSVSSTSSVGSKRGREENDGTPKRRRKARRTNTQQNPKEGDTPIDLQELKQQELQRALSDVPAPAVAEERVEPPPAPRSTRPVPILNASPAQQRFSYEVRSNRFYNNHTQVGDPQHVFARQIFVNNTPRWAYFLANKRVWLPSLLADIDPACVFFVSPADFHNNEVAVYSTQGAEYYVEAIKQPFQLV